MCILLIKKEQLLSSCLPFEKTTLSSGQARMLDRMLAEVNGTKQYDVVSKVRSKAVTIAPEMPGRLIQKHGFAVGDTFNSGAELSKVVNVPRDKVKYWY